MERSMRGVELTDRGPYTQTFTGGRFYPFRPRAEEIHIEDIAQALSMQCRFNGHIERFYSVAEHSVRASRESKAVEVQRWALLHDAAEAYIGDIVRPVKRMLPEMEAVEDGIMACIAKRFELAGEMPTQVHMIDERLCATEKRDLFIRSEDWPDMLPPFHWRVPQREIGPEEAKRWFLHRFYELWPERRVAA